MKIPYEDHASAVPRKDKASALHRYVNMCHAYLCVLLVTTKHRDVLVCILSKQGNAFFFLYFVFWLVEVKENELNTLSHTLSHT
jgi:hypothetical protein